MSRAPPPLPLYACVECTGTKCTVLLLLRKEYYWTPPIPVPGCVPMVCQPSVMPCDKDVSGGSEALFLLKHNFFQTKQGQLRGIILF
jgi:hypothetical protein